MPTETITPKRTKKISLPLRCAFTEKELLERGKQMAEKHGELAGKKEELDTIKSQFKSQIEGLEAAIETLSKALTSGYEYRPVTCTVLFDSPKAGAKTTIRMDTMEEVSIDQMTPAEMQSELPLTDKKAGVDGEGNVTVAADKGK